MKNILTVPFSSTLLSLFKMAFAAIHSSSVASLRTFSVMVSRIEWPSQVKEFQVSLSFLHNPGQYNQSWRDKAKNKKVLKREGAPFISGINIVSSFCVLFIHILNSLISTFIIIYSVLNMNQTLGLVTDDIKHNNFILPPPNVI